MNSKEFINIIGLVFTIIGGLIAIFLIPYSEVKEYIKESNWLLPVLLLIISLCFILIGFFVSNLILKLKKKNESVEDLSEIEFGSVTEREKTANIIWVVTKRLHYDINHPDYIKTIRENLKRGAKYRYIVPNTDEINSNLASYKELYSLDNSAIDKMFLKLRTSDIVKFLRPITIYDPYENNTLSYFYGHTRDKKNNDYLVFDNRKSIEYVNLFKSVWHKHTGKMPTQE